MQYAHKRVLSPFSDHPVGANFDYCFDVNMKILVENLPPPFSLEAIVSKVNDVLEIEPDNGEDLSSAYKHYAKLDTQIANMCDSLQNKGARLVITYQLYMTLFSDFHTSSLGRKDIDKETRKLSSIMVDCLDKNLTPFSAENPSFHNTYELYERNVFRKDEGEDDHDGDDGDNPPTHELDFTISFG